MLSPLQSKQGWAHLQSEPRELSCSQTPLVGLLGCGWSSTESFLCSTSSWMPISVFISDWPRWALSLVLLHEACNVILACTGLDCGLSVQAWPVERGRCESERGWMYEWISVMSLFIGWWLRVYPWPSFLLISTPPFLNPPLYRMAFSVTLLSTTGHPHPLSPAGKNKGDLIWFSPSYCQGLLEQCKTRQSGTFKSLSAVLCFVFTRQLVSETQGSDSRFEVRKR